MSRPKKNETSGATVIKRARKTNVKVGMEIDVEDVGMKLIIENGKVNTENETKTVSKSEPKALIDYFVKQREWFVSHGPKIFVVYQIGVFYEYYAKVISGLLVSEVVYNPESSFSTFLELTDFKIMDKKIVLDGYAVMGAGFRDTQLENYVSKLTDAGYTVVVYSQKETKKDGLQERFLDGVYSPGTYLPCVVADVVGRGGGKKSNHMMCIWAEILRSSSPSPSSGGGISGGHRSFLYKLHLGLSVMDIYSGASSLFEYEVAIERSKAFELAFLETGCGIGPEFVCTPALMDELERSIYTHQPTELLMIGKGEILDAIDNYTCIQHVMKHRVLLEDGVNGGVGGMEASSVGSGSGVGMSNIEKAFRCTKQKYIHGILVSLYGEKVVNQCSEFDMYLYATRAFCYMINFIGEHRSELITKLVLPEFYNTSDRVVLANHTLKQLNILEVEDSKGMGVEGRLQSVVGFLNRCRTAMGQRMIQTQITNPTFCEEWLEKEYLMTDVLLGVGGVGCVGVWIEWLRTRLSGVKDLEKMCRQLLLAKLTPNHLHHLYLSLEIILNIETQIKDSGGFGKEWFAYFSDKMADGVGFRVGGVGGDKLRELLKYIRFSVDLEACCGNSSLSSFDKPVVVDDEITYIMTQIETGEAAFSKMAADLNALLGQQDWVKWKTTEKGTMSLEMTKIRGGILQAKISEALDGVSDGGVSSVSWLKGLTIKVERGENSVCISNPELIAFSYKNVSLHEQLSSCSSKLYLRFLNEFCMKWYEVIDWYGKYTGWLDVLVCKAFLAREFHYCRPVCGPPVLSSDDSRVKGVGGDSESEISSISCSPANGCGGGYEVNCCGEDGSYVVAKGLRHVLIEHLQQREIYVANDLALGSGEYEEVNCDGGGGENAKGCLIYGTNAVGKTSLIRSLGIAIIMAQSGFYVPCSSFVYKPYTAIYSRILGNDNLFKGMSTFEVEMSELRVILREADSRSLILGDELCSGTEMESALSIFVASLEHLVRRGGNFLFATHFHEIAYYPEIESLIQKGGLMMKHLTVHFDARSGKLIYDRRLKNGPGNALYGLEVCKSLYLPLDFVERAYEIRRIHGTSGLAGLRIDGETRSVISLENNASVYNASKIRGICENCGLERSEEVHHKIPQKLADSRGFIVSSETGGVFHKNHAANLMNLCHKCHLKMHG